MVTEVNFASKMSGLNAMQQHIVDRNRALSLKERGIHTICRLKEDIERSELGAAEEVWDHPEDKDFCGFAFTYGPLNGRVTAGLGIDAVTLITDIENTRAFMQSNYFDDDSVHVSESTLRTNVMLFLNYVVGKC